MMRRMFFVTAGLVLALYAWQALFRGASTLAGVPAADFAWILWVGQAALMVTSAWLVAGWRGLTSRRRLQTAMLASLVAVGVNLATGVAILQAVPVSAVRSLGSELGIAIVYAVYAAETIVVAWVGAGMSLQGPRADPRNR
jgi:hypothetical protein